MKKSQILAALALAFALGVVAPVAGVYNTASVSAYSAEDQTVSGPEVEKAIAAVEANSSYKQAMALINAYAAYEKGAADGTYADYDKTNAGKIVDAANTAGITGDIAGVAANKTTGDNTIAETEAVINAIHENAEYKAMAQLNAAIEAKSLSQLTAALNNYYTVFNTPAAEKINLSDDTGSGVAASFDNLNAAVNTAASNSTATGSGAADFSNPKLKALTTFDATDAAIKTATDNITANNAAFKILDPVLSVNGILNATGKAALANAKNVPSDMAAIIASTAGSTTTYANANFVANLNLTNWEAVQTKLDDAGFADDGETPANYTKVENIAKAYKTATNSAEATSVIMTQLISYVAPEEPTDPTDPTDPEEPGQTITTITAGDVTVSGVIPEGVTLKVTPLNEKVAAFGENKYALYDIMFVDADGKKVDVNTELVVVIKVPADINGEKAGVFYVAEDGKVSKVEGAVYANGQFTFNVDHFSKYAIVENPDTVKVGDTGVLGSAQGTASTTISVVAGLATALTALGAGVVAYRNARRAE